MANYDVTPYGLWQEIQRLKKAICCRTVSLAHYTSEERDNLSPSEGMLIYNTTTNKLNFYNGNEWEAVTSVAVPTTTTTTSSTTTTTTTP